MSDGWDRYQEIFDQCINLKAIEFQGPKGKNFVTETLPNLSEVNQEIWKERICYFHAAFVLLIKMKFDTIKIYEQN